MKERDTQRERGREEGVRVNRRFKYKFVGGVAYIIYCVVYYGTQQV